MNDMIKRKMYNNKFYTHKTSEYVLITYTYLLLQK